MTDSNTNLGEAYRIGLRESIRRPPDHLVGQAFELGRKALSTGLGLSDVVRLHTGALRDFLDAATDGEAVFSRLQAAELFFLGVASAFQRSPRASLESDPRWKSLVEMLRSSKPGSSGPGGEEKTEPEVRGRRPEVRRSEGSRLSCVQDYFTVIDSDLVYQAANEAYCWAHGKSRDQVIGRKVADVWGEQVFRNVIEEPLRRCLEGQEVHYQASFEFPRTGLRYFRVSFIPFSLAGQGGRVFVITQDATEMRRMEEELRLLLCLTHGVNQSTDFASALDVSLRAICEAAGWGYGQAWVPSAAGAALEANAFASHHLAHTAELRAANSQVRFARGQGFAGRAWEAKTPLWIEDFEAPGEGLRLSLMREVGIRAWMLIPVVMGEEVLAILEFGVTEPRREDERLMWVVSSVTGQLSTLFHHKRLEAAFRRSEERFRTLVETANDVIFHLCPRGVITDLNQAFERITGWSRNEWIGQPFISLLHPEDGALATERLATIMSGEPSSRAEYRLCREMGGFAVSEITLTPELENGKAVGIFGIARDVTERRQAEEAVRQSEEHYRELFHQAFLMQENLRRLSNKILEVQEAERTRISRELHDEVGQALTAINVNLALMKRRLSVESPAVLQRVEDTQRLLERTMENVHIFARELRPPMLDDLGLLPALRSHVKDFSERTGIRTLLRTPASKHIERLCGEHKTVLYRVAQESLNNVAKHARATEVRITLHRVKGDAVLEVRDNGRGFRATAQLSRKAPRRLGLLGMEERARLMGGSFSVESEPGRGTLVKVSIPFKLGDGTDRLEGGLAPPAKLPPGKAQNDS